MEDVQEGSALLDSYREMAASGMIPLFNENDVLEKREMDKLDEGGDNDGLAAHVATRLGATNLLLLTADVDGFKVGGEVQSQVKIDDIPELAKHDFGKNNGGSGGIIPKLEAAAQAVIDGQSASDGQTGLRAFIGRATADYGAILAGEIGTEVIQ